MFPSLKRQDTFGDVVMRAIRVPMFHLERGCARGRQSFLGLLGVVGERVKQCPGDMGTSGQHGACIHKYNRCFEVFVFPRCLSRRATLVERGARLRERRVSHGITQQQVGEALCVPVEGSVPYSITLVV